MIPSIKQVGFGSIYIQLENNHWKNITSPSKTESGAHVKKATIDKYLKEKGTETGTYNKGTRQIVYTNDSYGKHATLYRKADKATKQSYSRLAGQGKVASDLQK